MFLKNLHGIASLIRLLSGENLKSDNAQGILIGLRRVVASGLFGGHVVRCTNGDSGSREAIQLRSPSKTQIDEFGSTVDSEKNIAGLHISMDNPLPVQITQSSSNRKEGAFDEVIPGGPHGLGFQTLGKRFPSQELRHQVEPTVFGLSPVVNGR